MKLRVLLIEDDPAAAEMVLMLLRRGGYEPDLKRVETAAALEAALDSATWDVAISDYHLPAFSAPEALAILVRKAPDLPCIVISGTVGEETAVELLKKGAADFVAKDKPLRLVPAVDRELREAEGRRRRGKAEKALRESESRFRTLFEASRDALMTLAPPTWKFTSANPATVELFGAESEAHFTSLGPWDVAPEKQPDGTPSAVKASQMIEKAMREGSHFFEWTHQRLNGQVFPATVLLTRMELNGQPLLQATVRDVTEQKRLEVELTHARKLESVGQLAAGIAHEINTPTQFVGDNTRFMKDGFGGLLRLIQAYQELGRACAGSGVLPERLKQIQEIAAEADVDYLTAEIPKAIDQSLEGVERIARIVRAMKDFSHPGGAEKEMANLNHAIETTVTVARNEWKYMADLETELDANLPPVPCFVSELNQVFLNLIVNAAHAIEAAAVKERGEKGRIRIATRRDGDAVEVRISDTGTGIAPEHQRRLFEPFFTTKAVGKGTGQGLALAYQVVKKHGGTITFETEMGKGTTFIVRLPTGAGEKAEG